MTKILVIEDTPEVRQDIVDILKFEGYEVVDAQDGTAGVQQARDHHPDLIICDIMMPGLDGYGVLDELRKDQATAMIPIVFLTALAGREDMRKGMGMGADDYITKPFTAEEVVEAVRMRLERKALMAKPLDELRQNLSIMLPHELRTPLASIIGLSALLADSGITPTLEERVQIGRAIHRNGLRLERLIGNYLLYAHLELMSTDPYRAESARSIPVISPAELIRDAVSEKTAHTLRANDVEMEIAEGTVRIAEGALRKVVEELVDNAVKFSQVGTPIRVAVHYSESALSLHVSDQGRGMTGEQIASIGAYVQFDRRLYEQQGSGLGLIIVKRLTELHGGKFSLTSAPNQGTTVTVVLNRNLERPKASPDPIAP